VDLYIHSPIRFRGVVLNYLSTDTTLPLSMRGEYEHSNVRSGGLAHGPQNNQNGDFVVNLSKLI
jgi:hypothetical protein